MSAPDQPVPSVPPSGPAIGQVKSPLAFLQPFGNDVCESWHEANPQASAPIHEEALSALRSLESQGRIVLLSAPRAGHGKTHLLGRVAAKLQPTSVVAALPWETRNGLSWHATAGGILEDLATPHRIAPHQEVTLPDICRGVLAMHLMRLVQTGKIPSANPAQALHLLQTNPKTLFTHEGPTKALAEWFQIYFPSLRKALASTSGITETMWVEAWLQRFMFVACQDLSAEENLNVLQQGIPDKSETQAETGAECLLRLIAAWKPMVLVADHMDGLYRDPEAGLAVARMALALSTLPRVRVVLSMNQDLWDTTLGRQLPSAMQDRLSASSINLHGMDLPEARALMVLRLREAGVSAYDSNQFLQFVDLESYFASHRSGVSPRELLRYAAKRWYRWLHPEAATDVPTSLAPAKTTAGQSPTKIHIPPTRIQVSDNDASAEDLERLRLSLENDAGGKHIDLSSLPIDLTSVTPQSGVVPLPTESDIPWQGSFLVMDEGETPSNAAPDQTSQNVIPKTPDSSQDEMVNKESPIPKEEVNALPSAAAAITPPSPPPPEATPSTAPSGALRRLGDMVAKFRKAVTPSPPQTPAVSPTPDSVATAPQAHPLSADNLRDRFEEARSLATSIPSDTYWLREVVNLAGESSALIKLDHIELPGLSSQRLPRWTWNGVEILFAFASFTHAEDWRLIASYIAGRLAEFANAASQYGEPMPEYKWVVLLQNDEEAAQLQKHIDNGIIPAGLEACLDRVQFSEPQTSDLIALWKLSQNTALQIDPTLTQAWQHLLADRLDFFWRRLTRPLGAATS